MSKKTLGRGKRMRKKFNLNNDVGHDVDAVARQVVEAKHWLSETKGSLGLVAKPSKYRLGA